MNLKLSDKQKGVLANLQNNINALNVALQNYGQAILDERGLDPQKYGFNSNWDIFEVPKDNKTVQPELRVEKKD